MPAAKPDLSYKPLDQWAEDDLECVSADDHKFLMILLNPKAATVVDAFYRKKRRSAESEMIKLAAKLEEPYYQLLCGRWLLRRFAWWLAARHFYLPLLRRLRVLAVAELLLPRALATVLLGMLAVCGSGAWPFLAQLQGGQIGGFAYGCAGLALLYYWMMVSKRSDRKWGIQLWRAAGICAWQYVWGYGAVQAYYALYCAHQRCYDQERYLTLLPPASMVVGMLIQEVWEDKPISEPL